MYVFFRLKREFTIVLTILTLMGCAAAFKGTAPAGSTAAKTDHPEKIPESDNVIIRVGDRTITRKALDLRNKRFVLKRRQKPSQEQIASIVDQLVEQTLFAEEARAIGLDKDETVQILIQDTVDKLLAGLYVHRYVLPDVQISEADIAKYYKTHSNAWRSPETVHARHILLRIGPRATAREVKTVETRALEIIRRLKAGENFARLASDYSEDTGTKNNGGDLGFFTRKGKAAAISDAVFAMQPGEISQPVRSSVGYHILQVIERRQPSTKPIAEVSGEIRSQLFREKQVATAKAALKRLEKKFNLYVNESILKTGESHAP